MHRYDKEIKIPATLFYFSEATVIFKMCLNVWHTCVHVYARVCECTYMHMSLEPRSQCQVSS